MATREEIYQAILNADKAGDGESVRVLGAHLKTMGETPSISPKRPAQSASYMDGRHEAPGAVQGLISVMQGPTFGFGDEIAGAIGGAYKTMTQPSLGLSDLVLGKKQPTFSDNYKSVRDYFRGAADSQAEENPITTMLTRGMASAPLMGVGIKGAQGAGLVKNALAAGANGAITGGVSGVGNSTSDTVAGNALSGLVGAAGGAALGTAAVPAVSTMGNMGQNALSRFSDSAAMTFARQKVAEALARDARGTTAQNSSAAIIPQVSARLGKLGDEGRLVDAAGQNTRQLLDTTAMLPGQTKTAAEQAIRSRQAGRADRLINSAEQSLGTNGDRAADVVGDLIRTRSQQATPLYGQLHRMEVQATPEMAETLNAAEQLGAGKVARDISTAAQLPYSLSAQEWSQSGGRLAMRDLDHMKQGIDTLIAKQTDPSGKVSPLGYQLQRLKDRLTGQLDTATNGFYKTARDAFAGPSALIDATNQGRRFMSSDDATTRDALAGLSTSEAEAFRLGAFEALRNKLGRPGGQTEVLGMWKDKILREKLQTVFPNERAFREFSSTVSAESAMKGFESVGRGSQTAMRQYGAGDMDVSAVGDVLHSVASPSTGLPALISKIAGQWNRVQTPEPVRDAMGQMLLSRGPQAQMTLAELEDAARQVAMRRSRNANALGVGAGQSFSNALSSLGVGR
jgi:hypothetical protein